MADAARVAMPLPRTHAGCLRRRSGTLVHDRVRRRGSTLMFESQVGVCATLYVRIPLTRLEP